MNRFLLVPKFLLHLGNFGGEIPFCGQGREKLAHFFLVPTVSEGINQNPYMNVQTGLQTPSGWGITIHKRYILFSDIPAKIAVDHAIPYFYGVSV